MADYQNNDLTGQWLRMGENVIEEGCILDPAVFNSICQIFLEYYSTGRYSPGQLTREYEREEFMLVLDEEGKAPFPSPEIVNRFQETAEQHAYFAKWFREEITQEGARILLAARWLCHLVGLRHGTVEIFIDPPHLNEYTLVQVRSLGKFEAPGAFDIPCAGHIDGVDTEEEALRKELAEELNLFMEDLSDFRVIKRYNSISRVRTDVTINIEHRVLYHARLKGEAVGRIRFMDGEVAGLAIFSVTELQSFVQRYPERIASGLSDAIRFYK